MTGQILKYSQAHIIEAIAKIVEYNNEEYEHYYNCVLDEAPDIEKSESFEYDDSLCKGHIYHSLRVLEKFLEQENHNMK